jgi:hypothetical protein
VGKGIALAKRECTWIAERYDYANLDFLVKLMQNTAKGKLLYCLIANPMKLMRITLFQARCRRGQ